MKEELELVEVDFEEYEEYNPHTILVNGIDGAPLTIDFDKEDWLELIKEKHSRLLQDTLIYLDEK